MSKLDPYFADVQAHYDLSDDFFALFLDPLRVYSCAYFERDDMTLDEAQVAKLDLSLGKLNLKPGQRLLDIGCGWGACVHRAVTEYGVNAVGLTLSENQHAHASKLIASDPDAAGKAEIRLAGWEQFEEDVDAIVSIGAFEHFRVERYDAFFAKCREVLPVGGRMLLHTIVWNSVQTLRERGIELTHDNVKFGKFIRKHIFPGGQLVPPETVVEHAARGGFALERAHHLSLNYARTLECWAENLEREEARAVELTSEETYGIYMKYLTGCAEHFRSGHLDVVQFTLVNQDK